MSQVYLIQVYKIVCGFDNLSFFVLSSMQIAKLQDGGHCFNLLTIESWISIHCYFFCQHEVSGLPEHEVIARSVHGCKNESTVLASINASTVSILTGLE